MDQLVCEDTGQTPDLLESTRQGGLEVHMEAVLDLPGVPDQTARCTEARLQILGADDVVRRTAGSIEAVACACICSDRPSAVDRRDRRALRERSGVEVRVVEEVEEVQAELDRGLLMEQRPVLVQRHVRVVEVRSADDTPLRHIAGECAKRIPDQSKCSWIDDCIAVTVSDGALSSQQRTLRRRKAGLRQGTALVQLARIRFTGS